MIQHPDSEAVRVEVSSTGEAYTHLRKEGKLIANDFTGSCQITRNGARRMITAGRTSCSGMSVQMDAGNISGRQSLNT